MASKHKILHMSDAPKIEILDDVVWIWGRSGCDQPPETMSIRNFRHFIDRGHRALDQHGAGGQHVIVDD